MDINGCHIVSTIDANSPDGFSSMVSRYVGFRLLSNEISADAVKVERGPFNRIADAIKYAQSWNDAATPPPMPEEKSVEPPPEIVETQTTTATTEESK